MELAVAREGSAARRVIVAAKGGRRVMVAAEGGSRGKRSDGGCHVLLSYIEHLYGVRDRVRLLGVCGKYVSCFLMRSNM